MVITIHQQDDIWEFSSKCLRQERGGDGSTKVEIGLRNLKKGVNLETKKVKEVGQKVLKQKQSRLLGKPHSKCDPFYLDIAQIAFEPHPQLKRELWGTSSSCLNPADHRSSTSMLLEDEWGSRVYPVQDFWEAICINSVYFLLFICFYSRHALTFSCSSTL